MPSSSGSWAAARGADIIDLDRYMRGNVRPSRTISHDSKHERVVAGLVVDGGEASRKPVSSASGDRHKRYSHDSGVSDSSYRRQRRAHRPHKRATGPENPALRTHREQPSVGTLNGRANSSSSLRAFKTVCEQALLDQQRQIARVTELCERLTQKTERSERNLHHDRSERKERVVKVERITSLETSEISSSSRSTKDQKLKDKSRTLECKTYKIIMNKLDELNRVLATRPSRAPPRARPRPASSSSVSVCDKLIATEPPRSVARTVSPTVQVMRVYGRGGDALGRGTAGGGTGSRRGAGAGAGSLDSARSPRSPRTARAASHGYAVDVTPRQRESTVKYGSSSNVSQRSAADPRCGFDLDDPVHLYSQAKRVQALSASTRRARSVEPTPSKIAERARERAPSLCAVCRAYWRYLRQCIDPVIGRDAPKY